MFINLKNSLMSKNNEEVKRQLENIENENMNTLNFYTTNLRQEQYKEGKISMDKFKACAKTKMLKETKKQLDKELKELEKIENNHKMFDTLYIQVQCKKTNLGYQYKATITDGFERIEGRYTGGWGYDKLSSAISEVLNEYLPLKELLYNYKEKYLFENKLLQANNHEIFGYGSGYGILPYFEGGVGVNSYYKIFNTIGLEFKQVNDTLYIITKK